MHRRLQCDGAGALAVLALLGFSLASPAPVQAQTVPSDLCTGDPCVVSGSHTVNVVVTDGPLDFGPVALVFAPTAQIEIRPYTPGAGVPLAILKAASITVQPGAHLFDPAGGDGVKLQATAGDIVLEASPTLPSRIDFPGGDGSTIQLDASGEVTVDGMIAISANFPYFSAGSIDVHGAQGVTIHGTLDTHSPYATRGVSGGPIHLDAGSGPVLIDGTLDVSGPSRGGSIAVSGADVSLAGTINLRGGGSLAVDATGSVAVSALVSGVGNRLTLDECSGQSTVTIHAGQDIGLSSVMKLSAAGNNFGGHCPSGAVSLTAGGSVTQLPGSTILANGTADADGGTVQIAAGGDVVLRDIDVSSTRVGGNVDVQTTGGAVQVLSRIKSRGPAAEVMLAGCDVYVATKGAIDSTGSAGGTDLTASETMTIVGKLQAGDGGNELHIREGAPLIGGTIAPAATVSVEPGLPDCRPGPSCVAGGTCGDAVVNCGEECDDGAANGTVGSNCDASCIEIPPALRIPGGGTKPLDCPSEWSTALGAVALDLQGLPKTKQTCRDNDPSCDFEPAPGVCRFHVWSCLGGADARLACSATVVTSTAVTAPKATSTKPAEIAARQSLVAALTALGAPVGPGEECSPRFDVVIGVGQKAIPLKTKAAFAGNKTDADKLELTCVP